MTDYRLILVAALAIPACSSGDKAVGPDLGAAQSQLSDAVATPDAFIAAVEDARFDEAEVELAKLIDTKGIDIDSLIHTFDLAREHRAETLVQQSVRALGGGDEAGATRLASEVVTAYPETTAAGGARELLATLASPGEISIDPDSNVVLASSRAADKRIAEAEKYLARGKQRNLTALSRSGSSASDEFDGATSDYSRAIDRLDAAVKDADASPEQRLSAQELRDRAVNEAIDVHLNSAQMYLNRGSYNQAQDVVAKALELNPDHAGANAFQQKVDYVSSERSRIERLRKRGGKKWRVAPP